MFSAGRGPNGNEELVMSGFSAGGQVFLMERRWTALELNGQLSIDWLAEGPDGN